jgi:hypothetical protein
MLLAWKTSHATGVERERPYAVMDGEPMRYRKAFIRNYRFTAGHDLR